MEVLKALEVGTAALDKLHKEMPIEEVERILEESSESMEVVARAVHIYTCACIYRYSFVVFTYISALERTCVVLFCIVFTSSSPASKSDQRHAQRRAVH